MLFEIVAIGCAFSIAIALFVVMIKYGDNPIKAMIVTIIYMYSLISIYIYVLKYVVRKKRY